MGGKHRNRDAGLPTKAGGAPGDTVTLLGYDVTPTRRAYLMGGGITVLGVAVILSVVAVWLYAGIYLHRGVDHNSKELSSLEHDLNIKEFPDQKFDEVFTDLTFSNIDDDDDGWEPDDDDDGHNDDDEQDSGIVNALLGGLTHFIADPSTGVGEIRVDQIDIIVDDGDILVQNGGQVTSACNNEQAPYTIASISAPVSRGKVLGRWGADVVLGFAQTQEHLLASDVDARNLDGDALSATEGVVILTNSTGFLSALLTDATGGVITSTAPVSIDDASGAYTVTPDALVAAHGISDAFLVASVVQDGSGGINLLGCQVTSYATPTFACAPLATISTGNATACPGVLVYTGSGNIFALAYNDAAGTQLSTIEYDVTGTTVTVLDTALVHSMTTCGAISGGIRDLEMHLIWGGAGGFFVRERVATIAPVTGVIAFPLAATILRSDATELHDSRPIGDDQYVVFFSDSADNQFGEMCLYQRTGFSIDATTEVCFCASTYPGPELASTVGSSVNLIQTDATTVVAQFPVYVEGRYSEASQVWELIGTDDLRSGGVKISSEITAAQVNGFAHSATTIVVLYNDDAFPSSGAEERDVYAVLGSVDPTQSSGQGRNVEFVLNKAAMPFGIALEDGVAGDEIMVMIQGCLEDDTIFSWPSVTQVCSHGNGDLLSHADACTGQGDDYYPVCACIADGPSSIRCAPQWVGAGIRTSY